jgi:hypothetical protein
VSPSAVAAGDPIVNRHVVRHQSQHLELSHPETETGGILVLILRRMALGDHDPQRFNRLSSSALLAFLGCGSNRREGPMPCRLHRGDEMSVRQQLESCLERNNAPRSGLYRHVSHGSSSISHACRGSPNKDVESSDIATGAGVGTLQAFIKLNAI